MGGAASLVALAILMLIQMTAASSVQSMLWSIDAGQTVVTHQAA